MLTLFAQCLLITPVNIGFPVFAYRTIARIGLEPRLHLLFCRHGFVSLKNLTCSKGMKQSGAPLSRNTSPRFLKSANISPLSACGPKPWGGGQDAD